MALHTVKSLFSSIPEGREKPAGKTPEKVEVEELPLSASLPKREGNTFGEQIGVKRRLCSGKLWKHKKPMLEIFDYAKI